ncbi:unnamed protein product [Rotaria sordida]|uniref:DUF3638 domain-containing protein n=1 Tax=Rotaria sordida TaxID=392033 RepID=A0A814PDI0_9BILA|nr:unnamed protein product [Rotaria sordida]CAF1310506.1 unnamed protein product [Rotaria sordida]
MNITVQEIQIKIAQHMIQPNMKTNDLTERNILLIYLHRILVQFVLYYLNHYFQKKNYQSLRCKLDGLLNRCIFPFACCRDMNFNTVQINQIFKRIQQRLLNYDIILTSPEDILSFDLLTIDKCRRNEFDVGRSML